MQTTANDLNAGSTNADAAVYTSTSGNWSTVTNVFTPTDGSTPANSINVGDYVSIFINAAAQTGFVAQVTNVAAGVNGGITVSATVVYGTAPTTNSGSRSLKAGGAWASLSPLNSFGATTVPQSTRINVKAGTYANTTNNRTVTLVGATTTPLWVRGYKSSPGDLDAIPTTTRVPGTDEPSVTFTSGRLQTTGNHQIWTNMSCVATSLNNATWTTGGSNQKYHRCRAENQTANASSTAFSNGTTNARFTQCWFKATTTATQAFAAAGASSQEFHDCAFEGGISNVNWSATSLSMDGCTFANAATQSLLCASANILSLRNDTFYNPGVDAIKITTQVTEAVIVNPIFHTVAGGTCINNATGTNTNLIQVCSPVYYNVLTQTAGLGDSPVFDAIVESSDPFVAASSLNFTVKPTAACYQKAAPQLFENQSNNVTYGTPGAVQPLGPVLVMVEDDV